MMPNTRLEIAFEAQQDLDDILQYTLEAWDEEQLLRYMSLLDQAFLRVQEYPELGIERANGIREHALRHHVILYRYANDTVTVLRVMHPRRLRDD